MSLPLKSALVLVVSVVLFTAAIFLAETELLDYVQAYFYNPSILNTIIGENERNAELIQRQINELQNTFASTLNEPAVRSSFLLNQSPEDIYERSKIYGILHETVSGLQSVQFVDSNGIRIHFSTSARDIISQSSESAVYRNYTDDNRAMPYDQASVSANRNAGFIMDDSLDRIIFTYPFYDSMDIYRGTALFTLSVRVLAERLIAEGYLNANDNISVIRTPPGVIIGSPDTSRTNIQSKVSSVWQDGAQSYVILDAEDSGAAFALISTRTSQNLFLGRLINNSIFTIPESMKIILYLSVFLTFFLAMFFLVNLRTSPVVLVRNRIKNLRDNLFEELYVNKSAHNRAKWTLELEQRREEIRTELKRGLMPRRKAEKNIDNMINEAWDEMLAAIKSGIGYSPVVSPAISTGKYKKNRVKAIEISEETKEIEKLNADNTENIEELEELLDFEDLEELEELLDADDIEEIEELEELLDAEDAEDIEELEELPDAEDIDTKDIKEDHEIEIIDSTRNTEKLNITAPRTTKGLLALASEIEKTKTPVGVSKGLFNLASEIRKTKAQGSVSRGLLWLASRIENVKTEKKEELERAVTAQPPKGLLALAERLAAKSFNQQPRSLCSKLDPQNHGSQPL